MKKTLFFIIYGKLAFHQLCFTTLANLTYDSKNHDTPKVFFPNKVN
jgi:hypothetical protein